MFSSEGLVILLDSWPRGLRPQCQVEGEEGPSALLQHDEIQQLERDFYEMSNLLTRLQNTHSVSLPVEVRSIALTIRDEVDGPITEHCMVELRRDQSLFLILCAIRPFRFWFALRSTRLHTSPHLNLTSFEDAQHQVDRWGTRLFGYAQPSVGHRLTL